ncbi:MAG: calcineurin-like phosphoesterase C-terminal domain-containing protein, partial [Pseudomonadota bacterium]
IGLIPRFSEVMGVIGAPQLWVHGNHDYDFDADFDENSADSWRRLWGPEYYAFEMGNVTFIVLDNVVYPCSAADNVGGNRDFCVSDDRKRYNGRISQEQMEFVANLLAVTPEDRTLVFAHHIPFVSFVDHDAQPHQTDNVTELYSLIGDRNALSLSGHTHTVENMAPGDVFEGWEREVDVRALPFRHLITGAVSGGWWNGDFDVHGVPMSLQRQGGPRGWVEMQFKGNEYTLDYRGTGLPEDEAMWLSINTPPFREWASQIMNWQSEPHETRDPVPPLSVLDLPDVKILTPEDLRNRSWLTANVWMGDSTTKVTVSLNGDQPVPMTRTQQAEGEPAKVGPEWSDPFAVQRQLTVSRGAIESRSGDPSAQGYKQGRYTNAEPAAPQPRGSLADRNMHLWTFELPIDLPNGVHKAEIIATREQGETARNTLVFEVRLNRPQRQWRTDVWEAYEDGPPVR